MYQKWMNKCERNCKKGGVGNFQLKGCLNMVWQHNIQDIGDKQASMFMKN